MTTLHYVVGDERHDAEGGSRDDRELTLLATPDVWAELVARELDPAVAYMQGRLKVSGDMAALYDLLPTLPLPA